MFLERLKNTHFCSTSFRPWFFFPPQYWSHKFPWVSKCFSPTPQFLPISIFIFSISFALHLVGREIIRHLLLGRKTMTNLGSVLTSRDITLPTKVCLVKAMVFPVVMYGLWKLDHKEGWELKNWYFWTVMLQKTLESPLDCKEIKPVNPKGNQPWIFIGRTDAEAEAPILWPPDAKSWLVRGDPDAGKDWGQEEKRATENEMVGWYHGLNGHEF